MNVVDVGDNQYKSNQMRPEIVAKAITICYVTCTINAQYEGKLTNYLSLIVDRLPFYYGWDNCKLH